MDLDDFDTKNQLEDPNFVAKIVFKFECGN